MIYDCCEGSLLCDIEDVKNAELLIYIPVPSKETRTDYFLPVF